MEAVDCAEVDEIKWSDARRASEHYRECKNLAAQKMNSLRTTILGRWQWLRDQAALIAEEEEELKANLVNK